MAYKYHTPAEYHQLIVETEREIDRRAEQAAEAQRLAAFEAYVNDPRNANEINNNPVVKALRQTPASPGWGPSPQQRPASQQAQPGRLPTVISGDARFHPSHLKLKPATPQVDSIRDPLVMSPGATIRQR